MNREQHQNEINQIRKHMKMLNITGGIAICALTLAGVLMVSDIFEAPAENITVSARESFTTPAIASITRPAENSKGNTGVAVLEIADAEVVKNNNAPSESVVKSRSGKKAITFEEELQSFEASCTDGSIVFHWVTSGGSKYAYEIEKTYDQVNYEVFSRAPAPEKIDGKNVYAVEETAAVGDDAFYRLRKVVGRGKYEYSEDVKVKCATAEAHAPTIDVFPNGNGSFRIMVNTALAGAFKVALSDVNETELVTEEFMAREGNNEFVLNTSNIAKGNYVLRVSNETMVKERKVVLK